MRLLRRNFIKVGFVAFVAMSAGFTPVYGQGKPERAGNRALPYLDAQEIRQEYKTYPEPKPRLIKDGPVNVTTVSRAAEKLIESELRDTNCKPRSGDCVRIGDKWVCTYQLQYAGIPLAKTSDAMCIIRRDGHAMVFRQRGVPRQVNATRPALDKKVAVEIGQKDFKERSKAQIVDVTDPSLELWVDGQQNGRLCWTFTITNKSLVNPIAAQYWVAAVGKIEVIAVDNLTHYAHGGTVTGTVWATTPLEAVQNLPLAYLDVICADRDGRARPTGLGGEYSFMPHQGSAQIRATLSGPACVIENYGGESVLTRARKGDGSSPINLVFDAKGEFEIAQVTAFYWTTAAHDFAKDFLLPSHLWQLTTRVNLDATCNAVFSGADVSINFFRAGNGCQNTASSDVIIHEYGHAIDFVHGGLLDVGYSEGFGDALAILVTRQPLIGRDFMGPRTFLRDGRSILNFSRHAEPHFHGQIYAGFTWELVQQLKKRSPHHTAEDAFEVAKHLILAADTMNPKDIPDAVRLAFLADDDDGDLTNGSPHFVELAAAADSRKIPRPADPVAVSEPWQAHVGHHGTHHLAGEVGTAFYTWNSGRRLATLKLEKTDEDFWYYCEKEQPEYRWAFAKKGNGCGQFAVWFLPAEEARGEWVYFHLANRVSPTSAHVHGARPLDK